MPYTQVMHKFKTGQLHSGSKSGPKVTSRPQAIAIMLSEKRQSASKPEYRPKGYQKGTAMVIPPPRKPMNGTRPAGGLYAAKLHNNRHVAAAGQMPVLPQAVAHGSRNAAKPPPSAPIQPLY